MRRTNPHEARRSGALIGCAKSPRGRLLQCRLSRRVEVRVAYGQSHVTMQRCEASPITSSVLTIEITDLRGLSLYRHDGRAAAPILIRWVGFAGEGLDRQKGKFELRQRSEDATPLVGDRSYGSGFAQYYDQYGTGWTRSFAPLLLHRFETNTPSNSVLDLACGTGVAAEVFDCAGWRVTAIDISPGMLELARARLHAGVEQGRSQIQLADVTDFSVSRPSAFCICLEGALNHLGGVDDLRRCFERIYAALEPGGVLVFDLYEPFHFRGWHNVTVVDRADAVTVKRGVWDEHAGVGMLRISGVYEDSQTRHRIDQTVTSRVFSRVQVEELLVAAGFTPNDFDDPVPACACGLRDGLCRRVYEARRC